MKFYECDVAAVLTNQYFTNSAVALSEKTDVLLWNRSVLEELRKCKKPRLLNLAGLLGMVGSAWLFYFLCSAGIDYRIFCDEPQFLEPQKYYQYCSAAGGSDHSGVW